MKGAGKIFLLFFAYFTAATAWVLTLAIIWISTSQTQLGYEIQRLKHTREILRERNLRLRCEIASLYDLDRARQYASQTNFKLIDPSTIQRIPGPGR
jgi:hypothetical protein